MLLDDVPPDVSFTPIAKNPSGQELAYQLKKETLGPHIRFKWAWDEDKQRAIHKEQFTQRDVLGVYLQNTFAGTLALALTNKNLHLDDFYIAVAFQKQGLGSKVLKTIQDKAADIGVPLTLQVLKWNPALVFYLRHGFKEVGQTENHVLMTWQGNMDQYKNTST